MRRKFSLLVCLVCCLLGAVHGQIPTPQSHFGFQIGDDYQLANFTQTEAYFKKLANTSNRAKLVDIGETEEGRRQFMMIVSSPDNLKKLEVYREISQKLARAEISVAEAQAYAQDGKAIVWIDGGLHSTETVAMHQLIETAYQLNSRQDRETLEILDKVVILMVHANPDGQELVGDWYMREPVPEKRSLAQLPRMYQKYAGHDNNRDFFMFTLKETQNMAQQLFVHWIPQIVFNHHQTAPAGTVVVGPPYRDPFNYVFDPILMTSLDGVGAAMHTRLNIEGKPGYGQRGSSGFSTWWNGGLRTSVYFRNMIGILTEIIGGPNPTTVPLVPNRMVPNGDSPNPVTPRAWHFRESIDYSVSLNYAVLNYAARHRDELLFNIYRMGRNGVERGGRDHWSLSPSRVDAMRSAYTAAQKSDSVTEVPDRISAQYWEAAQSAEQRDPRGYILSADQPDLPATVRFLNALIQGGVAVQVAADAFSVEGAAYPKGSYIVKTAQAFRPQVLDMFEPQDHPNDVRYEGGPPVPPYDAAGWTLAYLMGVKFDRLLDDFSGPFEQLEYGKLIKLDPVAVPKAQVYRLSAKVNHSFTLVNALLKAGNSVYRDPAGGDFYVPNTGNVQESMQQLNKANVTIFGETKLPAAAIRITPSRVAIWDRYGGSMPSGWLRWILEEYNFNFSVIYPSDIDKGSLRDQYDVIVFVGGAIPASLSKAATDTALPAGLPANYAGQIGDISSDRSLPQLQKFVTGGGKIVTIGSSAHLATHLGVPVKNALTELVEGRSRALPTSKFFIPGSVLRAELADHPATWGMEEEVDVYFARSPVFNLTVNAVVDKPVVPLMWFGSEDPLRSGWALGQSYLSDGMAAFKVDIDQGELYVFGPEITFRAQTHGTFKLLFNQLFNHTSR